jgi:hypothetical protein
MRLLLLRGRSERRVPVGVPLYLARASLPAERELAIAVDVGEGGLCAVTSRYWRPGEVLQITPLSDEPSNEEDQITAKVAYCWRQLEHTCHTGLVLERPTPGWWKKFQTKTQK